MPNLMPVYDALPQAQQSIALDMAMAARDVLRTAGIQPPADDRSGIFTEACAVLLTQSLED
jgi:hypothetical protein